MTPLQLKPEQMETYRRDGFLVVDQVLRTEEVDAFVAYEQTRPREQDMELLTHVTDATWRRLATHPGVAGVAAQLLDGTPCVVQAMYMPKKASQNAAGTALHQDSHYLPAEPNTLMACWIAMSDTGADNGGLCVVSGSHLQGLRSTHSSSGDEHNNWHSEHLMRDHSG
jgi:hypothetical protein